MLGANWQKARWDANAQVIRYGRTTSMLTYYHGPKANSITEFNRINNSPIYTLNLAVGYQPSPNWKFTLGGDNVFDVYPKRIPRDNSYQGVQPYDGGVSGVGINGGYYYGRVSYSF